MTNCRVGTDIHADELRAQYDAVALTIGSTKPRDLPIPGRELERCPFRDGVPCRSRISATPAIRFQAKSSRLGKRVVILGGGDTGSDCLGTSNRQGAIEVSQFELLPMPPDKRTRTDAVAGLADDFAHLDLA